jgi:hypothetical protein
MPLTATTREGIWSREGIAPSGLRAGSPAHAAHTFPPVEGGVFGWALQGHGAVTRESVSSTRLVLESADAFCTRRDFRAWG